MMAIFGVLFVAAQGGVIFSSAFVLSMLFPMKNWLLTLILKTALMAASYILWVTLTLFVFFWGADSYLIFAGLAYTAALSSAVYWLGWLLAPLFQDKIIGRAQVKREAR